MKDINIILDWYKGEQPHLMWKYYGKNEDTVTIAESEGDTE